MECLFVGIRILKCAADIKGFKETIDFTTTVQMFYQKMIEHIIQAEELDKLHKEKKVDIQIRYVHQDDLEDEIAGK